MTRFTKEDRVTDSVQALWGDADEARKTGLKATFTSGGGNCDLGQPWGQSRALRKHSFHGATIYFVPCTVLTPCPPPTGCGPDT